MKNEQTNKDATTGGNIERTILLRMTRQKEREIGFSTVLPCERFEGAYDTLYMRMEWNWT